MAKPDADPIMAPAQLKPLLMLSKHDPVNCAIGMTKDKQGVLLLDKKAKPRAVSGMMKKKAVAAKVELDATTLRFGRASVDPDIDAALVMFTVNKDAPGTLRPKLLELLKKCGFSKCEIVVDESLDSESENDDQSITAEATATGGPDDAVEVTPSAPATSAPADPGAVTTRLADLVRSMMIVLATSPAGADAMKTAALGAQASLKAGDVAGASQQADSLERLLAAATAAPGSAAPAPSTTPMGSPVFDKARMTWIATRKKVGSELDKLHGEIMATYTGHGAAADLDKAFRGKVEPIMDQLDESLSEKLAEVVNNNDQSTHVKLVGEARQIIANYEAYLSSEPLIARLDANPFVPLAIEKTLTATLSALSKSVV